VIFGRREGWGSLKDGRMERGQTAHAHAEAVPQSFLRIEELEIRDQFDGWMINLKQ
jgi:hypothetical protein